MTKRGPDPITRQRSRWKPIPSPIPSATAFRRNVHDGVLQAIVSIDDEHYHLSISHRRANGQHVRYPTWDEMTHARGELLPPDRWFAMYFPPSAAYVTEHPTTFHLFECDPQ